MGYITETSFNQIFGQGKSQPFVFEKYPITRKVFRCPIKKYAGNFLLLQVAEMISFLGLFRNARHNTIHLISQGLGLHEFSLVVIARLAHHDLIPFLKSNLLNTIQDGTEKKLLDFGQ